MKKRGRYSTRQQELILDCIIKQKGIFYSISEIMEHMQEEGIRIGQTTVYRALERLADDGVVLKIPAVDGNPAQYSFAGSTQNTGYGQLICMNCGSTIPIRCGCIEEFSSHIRQEHHFELNRQRTILYGYCENCRNSQMERNRLSKDSDLDNHE